MIAPELVAEIRRVWLEGVPARDMCERFGVTKHTIAKHTRDLPRHGTKAATPTKVAEIRRWWVAGAGQGAICEELRVTSRTVARYTSDLPRETPKACGGSLEDRKRRVELLEYLRATAGG